jgi:hypothetical protein
MLFPQSQVEFSIHILMQEFGDASFSDWYLIISL